MFHLSFCSTEQNQQLMKPQTRTVCVSKWFTESTEKSLLYAVDPHLVYQLDRKLPRRNDTLLHCLSLRTAYAKHVCGATTTRMYTTDSLTCPRHITQTEPSTRTPLTWFTANFFTCQSFRPMPIRSAASQSNEIASMLLWRHRHLRWILTLLHCVCVRGCVCHSCVWTLCSCRHFYSENSPMETFTLCCYMFFCFI